MALYHDIASAIEDRIAAERLRPGARLGTHAELVDEFRVSRGTVTKAIEVLEARGLVRSEQGRGTFVRGVAPRVVDTALSSFSESVRAAGATPGAELLSYRRAESTGAGLHQHFATGAPLVEFERVRLIDGEPVGVHHSAVPLDVATVIELESAWSGDPNRSLYRLMEEHGIHPDDGFERYDAVLSDDELQDRLSLPGPTALLRVRRHTTDLTGAVVESVDAIYEPSRYQLGAHVRRGRPGLDH